MRVAMVLVVGMSCLAGCMPARPPNPLAGVPPEELQAASKKAQTPAGISTVQFKELGDAKRYAVMTRIIKNTWGETCNPTAVTPSGYSPNGSSQWRVHCDGSSLLYDYTIGLPETADKDAMALQCYANGRALTCTILGKPAGVS